LIARIMTMEQIRVYPLQHDTDEQVDK